MGASLKPDDDAWTGCNATLRVVLSLARQARRLGLRTRPWNHSITLGTSS